MSGDDVSPQRYGRVIIVGGGCYGGYYVRQLLRAIDAGAVEARALVVVDQDANCAVARDYGRDNPLVTVDAREWRALFDDYLSRAAADPPSAEGDAIVPSPLMPHLMAEWLVARARQRWPDRAVATAPLDDTP